MLDQLEREENMACDTCKNKEFLMQLRQDMQNNNMRIDSLQQNYSDLRSLSDVTAEKTKVSFKLINEIKDDIKVANGDLKRDMNHGNEQLRKEFGMQHELLKNEMTNNNNALKNDINNISNNMNNQFLNISNSMQIVNSNVTKVSDKMDKFEKKPAETWDKVKWMIAAGIMGFVFFIGQELFKLIIK